MAIAALQQLHAWQIPRIAAALSSLTATITAQLAELELDCLPPGQRGPHLLGVSLPDSVRSNILPALTAMNCFASVRGASLRIAPHLHVNDGDVERLTAALGTATAARSGMTG